MREHHRDGFLQAEGIEYPAILTGTPYEILEQTLGWLRSSAGKIRAGGAAQASAAPARKTNAERVYDALASLAPSTGAPRRKTLKDITQRAGGLAPAVVEKNLEWLEKHGLAFTWGPSGQLGILSGVKPLPFWATREQVIGWSMADASQLPPVTAKWAPEALAPESSEAVITAPSGAASPVLRIDSPSALSVLASIEGGDWLQAQERDRGPLEQPRRLLLQPGCLPGPQEPG